MVGRVAVWCQPRSNISKSGILAAFVKLYDHSISNVSVEFIQCALLAGHYRFAARILGNDWPLPNKSNYSLESILRYYYLRGLVYTGCHDWYMALRCFGTVLMVPTDTIISQIVMDAWTKWVILRCLVWNDPVLSESSSPSLADLPPGGSFAFGRYCSSRMDQKRFKPYFRIAKSCDNLPLMRQIFADHSNIWELDGTTGLIQQLIMELEFRSIHHLASIYSNLPLSLMAKHLQVTEEETRQILCQVPNVHFDIKDGIVTITSTNDDSETATNDLVRLTHRLRQVDTTFTKSSRYQSYLAEKAKVPRSISREGF
jgi:PCI domain